MRGREFMQVSIHVDISSNMRRAIRNMCHLADLTVLSHKPPKCDAYGGINHQSMLSAIARL